MISSNDSWWSWNVLKSLKSQTTSRVTPTQGSSESLKKDQVGSRHNMAVVSSSAWFYNIFPLFPALKAEITIWLQHDHNINVFRCAFLFSRVHLQVICNFSETSLQGGDLHGKLEPGIGLGPEISSRCRSVRFQLVLCLTLTLTSLTSLTSLISLIFSICNTFALT